MLNFPPSVRIWLAATPVDLRRSFDLYLPDAATAAARIIEVACNAASSRRRVASSNPGATRTIRPSTSTTSRALAWAGVASATTCTGTNAGSSAARRSSTRRQL